MHTWKVIKRFKCRTTTAWAFSLRISWSEQNHYA